MQAPGAIDVRNPPIQGGNQLPAGQHNDPRAPNNPMTLSKEEQMIFEKCRSESYWYRSLPYSLGLGTAAMYAGKMGYLAAHPKYGPWPKTVLAAAVGYFAGKISYASVCQDKFVQEAPNSNIGRTIRKRRGEVLPEISPDGDDRQLSQDNNALFPDGKDTANTGGDTGYSDYFSQGDKNIEERHRSNALTYDQLRAQHRVKEMEKPHMQQGALIQPSTPVDPLKTIVPPAPYSPKPSLPSDSINMYPEVQGVDSYEYKQEPSGSSRKRTTNKYGDEGFE